MKKNKILKALAKASKRSAAHAAVSVSQFGCYQPKEPKGLKEKLNKRK